MPVFFGRRAWSREDDAETRSVDWALEIWLWAGNAFFDKNANAWLRGRISCKEYEYESAALFFSRINCFELAYNIPRQDFC